MDDNGKMSLGVEVEPPEDMDEIQYNIDPNMRIWESMAESKQDEQPWVVKEDSDELHHPSTADLLQNLPEDDFDEEILESEPVMMYGAAAEEDSDDIDDNFFSEVTQEEPEEEWDEDKARDALREYLEPLVAKERADMGVQGALPKNDEDDLGSPVRSARQVRLHLQPEEDMDDLYHKDPVIYQEAVRAVAPADLPSWVKHSEPEEDLDHLHHQ